MNKKELVAEMEHHMRILQALQGKVNDLMQIGELTSDQKSEHSHLHHQIWMVLNAMQWDCWMASSEHVGGGWGSTTPEQHRSIVDECLQEIDPNLDPQYAQDNIEIDFDIVTEDIIVD